MKIGNRIIHFDQLPSTNAHGAELLSTGRPPEGTVISTDNQFQGKGQLTNSWESEPYKNISLSVLLYPSFIEITDQFRFNQAIALSVFHTLDSFCPGSVSIKWPNDLYVGRKKVAGILIQNQIQGKVLASSIVGIGINVNQEHFKSDALNPTSLYLESNNVIDLTNFKLMLYQNLDEQYQNLKSRKFKHLDEEYHSVLYQRNKINQYQLDNGEVVSGTILGVNESGLLQVQIDGTIHDFGFKEIRYLR